MVHTKEAPFAANQQQFRYALCGKRNMEIMMAGILIGVPASDKFIRDEKLIIECAVSTVALIDPTDLLLNLQ